MLEEALRLGFKNVQALNPQKQLNLQERILKKYFTWNFDSSK